MVEKKQIEEKEELLDTIDQERLTLSNEVESKLIERSVSDILFPFLVYENQVLSLENQLGDCQQFLKQLKTYKARGKNAWRINEIILLFIL